MNLAIFASGNGSNAINIINYFEKKPEVNVLKVFCNNPKAPIIEKARSKGINTLVFSKSQLIDSDFILTQLKALRIDYIILAGFLLKIPESIIEQFKDKIINIHPALLPKYGGKGMYGMNVHKAVVHNKEPKTGITIHYVNENYDEGAIIFQADCEVLKTDTPESVAAKIHTLEMQYFPRVIEQTVKGF
jgi:phosphoribosylglycinamide formyltransferase-1